MRIGVNRGWKFLGLVAFSTGLSVLALACGGDDDDTTGPTTKADASTTTPDTGTTVTVGSIALTATYSGTIVTGTQPLIVSVWPTAEGPAAGGTPSGSGANRTATWPGTNTVTVSNVSPGSYFLFAYADVGTDHEMGPEPGDAITPTGVPVTVAAAKSTSLTVSLLDYTVVDAGGPDADAGNPDAAMDSGSQDAAADADSGG